jgi:hypothetical protein
MTQRERHTPDRGPSQPSLSPPPLWGEWYHRASPAQQQEALARAAQQGILYAHQLAAPAHAEPRRSLLSALLNGSVKELQPLHPPTIDCHDRALDATQCDAVARAVVTPDVCLIQGFPGTGKSRVVAEILLQAAQRGERVLFLAPTTAALNHVLERLGTLPAVCPIRCLTADESAQALPAPVARLTLAERLRTYRENTVPAARAARDAVRAAGAAWRQEETIRSRLEALIGQHEQLAGRLQALAQRRAGLAVEVENQAQVAGPLRTRRDTCARARAEALERLDGQLAVLRAELETITAKQGHLENEWEQVRPLAEARQGRRFWTGTFWRARLRNGLAEQIQDLQTRRAELQSARCRLEQDIASRLAERTQAEEHYQAECRRLQDEEIARRQGELDAEEAKLARQQDQVREQWLSTCQTLTSGSAPVELSRPALESARADWQRRGASLEEQVAAAEEWLRAVEAGLETLADKLTDCANIVTSTTTALPADPHFGDRDGRPAVLFDLLVLEEAHQVTESEFAAAARRARRWVLVGEPQLDAEPTTPRRTLRNAALRPGFFQRLWHNLHTDPRRSPFAWTQRDGRLTCRLRFVAADQQCHVESEPVVDHPEIELRILSTPRQAPQVVEVLFPAHWSITEAKQFIYRELDELAVHPRGRAMTWRETADDVILELAPVSDPDAVRVELAEGVCERVACVPVADGAACWSTSQLQFGRAAGWTLALAEQWIAQRLGLCSVGRTVLLTVPHRLAPPLAHFLSDLLFGGACQPPGATPVAVSSRAAVEFVAVPSLENRPRADADARRNGGESHPTHAERGQFAVSVRAPRLRTVKGGAGLELDLADDRPLEQLPGELRALLPRHGLVNYLEARALVKRLEALIAEDDFVAACQRWRERHAGPCVHGCTPPAECACPQPDGGPAVAVMALYPAQAELLRHLIRQSPALANSPVAVEVGPPAAFGQRECLLALVSLTRSHAHRACSYGDHPHALAQALTRAAAGLILFGDPGTLARRSQWRGALDHLDESAAQRESSLVGQLVHYLQGHGPHPTTFHLHEGSSV